MAPEAVGEWRLIQIFLGYLAYSNLGLLSAFGREGAIAIGRGATDEYRVIAQNVQAGTLFLCACASGGVFVAYVAGWTLHDTLSPTRIVLIVLLLFSQQALDYVRADYLVRGQFGRKSFAEASFSAANLLLTLVLTRYLAVEGVILAWIVADVAVLAVCRARFGFYRGAGFATAHAIMRLGALGARFTSNSLMKYAFLSIDSIVVAHMFGLKVLAYWSIGVLFLGVVQVIPEALNGFVGIRMAYAFARKRDPTDLRVHVALPTVTCCWAATIIGLVVVVGSEQAVRWWSPQYMDAVAIVGIFSLISVVESWRSFSGSALNIVDRPLLLSVLYLFGTLAKGILVFAAGSGVGDVAVAATLVGITHGTLGLMTLTAAFRAMRLPVLRILPLAAVGGLGVVTIAGAAGILRLLRHGSLSLWLGEGSAAAAILLGAAATYTVAVCGIVGRDSALRDLAKSLLSRGSDANAAPLETFRVVDRSECERL